MVDIQELRPTRLSSLCQDLKSPSMEHTRGLPIILEWCMALLAMKNEHQCFVFVLFYLFMLVFVFDVGTQEACGHLASCSVKQSTSVLYDETR